LFHHHPVEMEHDRVDPTVERKAADLMDYQIKQDGDLRVALSPSIGIIIPASSPPEAKERPSYYPMSDSGYDVAIIGAGPAGYVCAIRAAQLGLHVAVIERESIGGVCLNTGCIPAKSLLRNAEIIHLLRTGGKDFGFQANGLQFDYGSAVKRSRLVSSRLVKGVEFLLRKNKIDVLIGSARIREPGMLLLTVPEDDAPKPIAARHIVIATGASPATPAGIIPNGTSVLTYREAILQETQPASVAIIGAGPIGLEFATLWNAYGSAVTLIEMMPRIAPLEDEESSAELARALQKRGIRIRTNSRVQTLAPVESGVRLTFEAASNAETLDVAQVLIATGFRPNTLGLGLAEAGVQVDKNRIVIDDKLSTTAPGIWAIGDVTGKMMLAHVGSAMGIACAERMAGRETPPLSYENMPRAIYTHPQVASFGLTEAQARERGLTIRTAKFPFQANGKALGMGDYAGWVKLIAERPGGRLVGAHLVGPDCSELLPELTLAHHQGLPIETVARNIHGHPTLGEAVQEAAHGLTEGYLHL
jgi:dihydrolipoamide dehydrogenase